MGLTIHYSLRLPGTKSATEARAFLKNLHAFAATLPFNDVTPILSWKRGNEPMVGIMHEFPVYDENKSDAEVFFAKPLELLFFVAHHPGSESPSFGLARYAKTAPSMTSDNKRPSDLPGWNWHKSVKTQYASLSHEGGWPNFFAVHDGICRILDHAASLGASVKVLDESKYWEHRDPDKLHAEIDRWNAMVAAVVGQFKNRAAAGEGNVSMTPITAAPEFEHLEAKGQPFLDMVPEIKVIRLREPKPPRGRSSNGKKMI